MAEKIKEWPERRELVLGTVVRVNPYSALVSLEEYKGKEGMIHISEVAGKWVRDIRKFVKQGQKVVVLVLNVDSQKGHINLSLKRVRRYDAEKKMREYKEDLKAQKMIRAVAKKLDMELNEALKTVDFQLREIFGESFSAFKLSMTDEGYQTLLKRGVPENWAKVIRQVAEEQMEVKEINIKLDLELKSYQPDGINIIKESLKKAKENNDIEIKYISAPKYTLTLKTKEPKAGEKKIREIAENVIKDVTSTGGEGTFKVD